MLLSRQGTNNLNIAVPNMATNDPGPNSNPFQTPEQPNRDRRLTLQPQATAAQADIEAEKIARMKELL